MRLINTATLKLEEFTDNNIPVYAILSHTWDGEELSFSDLQHPGALFQPGRSKIRKCCSRAAADGLRYLWVDTCCINKGSSAELSEAINSMYRWYKRSKVCYAYLSDVSPEELDLEVSDGEEDNEAIRTVVTKSKWLRRGWTLQELIAPQNVVFFASNWTELGTKADWFTWLSEVTGIDEGVLLGKSPERVPVAHRMSWASKRETTRVEDMAYSLMGLFGVNMPMIYGEGERAFIRLQEEIMTRTHDRSLFAWKSGDKSYRGLLARSPAEFASCKKLVRDEYTSEQTRGSGSGSNLSTNDLGNSLSSLSKIRIDEIDAPFSQTNMGLCIRLPLIHAGRSNVEAILDWRYQDEAHRVRIPLERLPNGKNEFVRRFSVLAETDTHKKCYIETIYVKQFFEAQYTPREDNLSHTFHIKPKSGLLISKAYPAERWSHSGRILQVPAERPCVAGVLLLEGRRLVDGKNRKIECVLYLGCDNEACCWAYIGRKPPRQELQELYASRSIPKHYEGCSLGISPGKHLQLNMSEDGPWLKRVTRVDIRCS